MTEKIYLKDSYILEFDSPVVSAQKREEHFEVVLKSTAFYPESGGQLHDGGILDGCRVNKVYENKDGDVVHCLDDWTKKTGEIVSGKIDRVRRLANMRKHTGQHILSMALIKIAQAETMSSRLGEIESTVEVSQEAIDSTVIQKAEDLANEIIMKDYPVAINYYEREELSRLPIRKIPERTGIIRIIQIGDFDYTACGGTHCHRTGEIGLVKIIRQEKLRGHLRLIFLTGKEALHDYAEKHQQISMLSGMLTCHFRELDKSISRLIEQNISLRREVSLLNGQILSSELRELIASSQEYCGIKIAYREYNNQDLKNLKETATKAVENDTVILVLVAEDKILVAVSKGLSPNAVELARTIMEQLGGKGGGGPIFAQVGGIPQGAHDRILEIIKETISLKLKSE